MKKHNYKAGDKVRIIGNGMHNNGKTIRHFYALGDIVTVNGIIDEKRLSCIYLGVQQHVSVDDVELVTTAIFNRDDIKAGYLLEVKNEKTGDTFYMTVVPSKYADPEELVCCCPGKDWRPLHAFDTATLTCAVFDKVLTVLRVYGPSGNRLLLDNTPEDRKLLWERTEEPKVVEMTVAEISEKLGFEVKIVKEK